MEFVTRVVPKNFNLFLSGDIHIGSTLFHENGFKAMIKTVQEPYDGVSHNVVAGMGDYIEAIDTSDKRFDAFSADLNKIRPAQQMDYFIEHMQAIKKNIAVLLYGNHEHKLMRYYDYVQGACDALKVPYGTYSAVVSFVTRKGEPLFKAFLMHGMGSVGSTADSPERRKANMRIQIKRKLYKKAGDCALMAFGHTHKLIVAPPEKSLYLRSDGTRVTQHYTHAVHTAEFIPKDLRWYVNTGSLLKLFARGISGYAERAMYDPMELGYPIVRVRDGVIAGVDKVIV